MSLDVVLPVRDRDRCPVCGTSHALTHDRRLWTHGPRGARCRGSQRTIAGARMAALDVRGARTLTLPEEV